MASQSRRESADLSVRLFKEPERFGFFQAVRLLDWIMRGRRARGERRPGAAVGQDAAPDQELVRFRALPSLSFPANEVAQLGWRAAEEGQKGSKGDRESGRQTIPRSS